MKLKFLALITILLAGFAGAQTQVNTKVTETDFRGTFQMVSATSPTDLDADLDTDYVIGGLFIGEANYGGTNAGDPNGYTVADFATIVGNAAFDGRLVFWDSDGYRWECKDSLAPAVGENLRFTAMNINGHNNAPAIGQGVISLEYPCGDCWLNLWAPEQSSNINATLQAAMETHQTKTLVACIEQGGAPELALTTATSDAGVPAPGFGTSSDLDPTRSNIAYNVSTGQLFVWDPVGLVWIETTSKPELITTAETSAAAIPDPGVGANGALDPAVANIAYNPTTGRVFMWDVVGTAWVDASTASETGSTTATTLLTMNNGTNDPGGAAFPEMDPNATNIAYNLATQQLFIWDSSFIQDWFEVPSSESTLISNATSEGAVLVSDQFIRHDADGDGTSETSFFLPGKSVEASFTSYGGNYAQANFAATTGFTAYSWTSTIDGVAGPTGTAATFGVPLTTKWETVQVSLTATDAGGTMSTDSYTLLTPDFHGDTLLVSVGGDDAAAALANYTIGTDVMWDHHRPFGTMQAALAAATAGDTIRVERGTYAQRFTLKDGVDIDCDEGVVFDGSGLGATNGSATIYDNNTAVTVTISGRPDVINDVDIPSASAFGVFIQSGASNVTLELGDVTAWNGLQLAGTTNVDAKNIAFSGVPARSSAAGVVYRNDVNATLKADTVIGAGRYGITVARLAGAAQEINIEVGVVDFTNINTGNSADGAFVMDHGTVNVAPSSVYFSAQSVVTRGAISSAGLHLGQGAARSDAIIDIGKLEYAGPAVAVATFGGAIAVVNSPTGDADYGVNANVRVNEIVSTDKVVIVYSSLAAAQAMTSGYANELHLQVGEATYAATHAVLFHSTNADNSANRVMLYGGAYKCTNGAPVDFATAAGAVHGPLNHLYFYNQTWTTNAATVAANTIILGAANLVNDANVE